MRRSLFVLLAAVLGIAIGVTTSLLLTAFSPVCGEDCSNDRLANLLVCTLGGLVAFVGVALFFSRRSPVSPKLGFIVCVALSALFLTPASAHYVYTLHAEYRRLEAIAPVQPSADFFHMAIATRVIQGFTDASAKPVKPVGKIPQWQRCLIGAQRCETSPRQIEVLCKVGVVNVNEVDWPAFALVPQENVSGVAPLSSMRLCAE